MTERTALQWIDRADFPALKASARAVPRRRTNFNFHAGPEDPVQRMLNIVCADSYVTPHRHVTPPKSETFLMLEGLGGVLLFDDDGEILQARVIGGAGNPLGADIPAGMWHAIIALSEIAIFYEIKPGPYDPVADKEMAPWAPKEGDPAALAYLADMQHLFA